VVLVSVNPASFQDKISRLKPSQATAVKEAISRCQVPRDWTNGDQDDASYEQVGSHRVQSPPLNVASSNEATKKLGAESKQQGIRDRIKQANSRFEAEPSRRSKETEPYQSTIGVMPETQSKDFPLMQERERRGSGSSRASKENPTGSQYLNNPPDAFSQLEAFLPRPSHGMGGVKDGGRSVREGVSTPQITVAKKGGVAFDFGDFTTPPEREEREGREGREGKEGREGREGREEKEGVQGGEPQVGGGRRMRSELKKTENPNKEGGTSRGFRESGGVRTKEASLAASNESASHMSGGGYVAADYMDSPEAKNHGAREARLDNVERNLLALRASQKEALKAAEREMEKEQAKSQRERERAAVREQQKDAKAAFRREESKLRKKEVLE